MSIDIELQADFIAVIMDENNKSDVIAKEYGALLYFESVEGDCIDFSEIDQIIYKRFSLIILCDIKRAAWKYFSVLDKRR